MVVRKKKKMLKYRGRRSQGYGLHKKHRGGGSRGGRGQAGMHKHKWSYTVKYDPNHFGKDGFKRPFAENSRPKPINLKDVESLAGGKKKIELEKFGYDKVLGGGNISSALEIVAESFSKKALEKIEAAGGKAVVLEKKAEPAEKED